MSLQIWGSSDNRHTYKYNKQTILIKSSVVTHKLPDKILIAFPCWYLSNFPYIKACSDNLLL